MVFCFTFSLWIKNPPTNPKRLPKKIFTCNKETVSELIAGLFDTDGNISYYKIKSRDSYKGCILLTSICKELLIEVQTLLLKFGIHGIIRFKPPRKNNSKIKDVNGWYNLEISDKDSIVRFKNNFKHKK